MPYFPIGKYRFHLSPVRIIISRSGKNWATMTTISTVQALGAALRSARKRLGLTQPELALAAGVGVRFIVDLEAGKPSVRLEQVLRVIDALGGALVITGLDPEATQA